MRRVALIGVVALLVIGLAWWVASRSADSTEITIQPATSNVDATQENATGLEAVESPARRAEAPISVDPVPIVATADSPDAREIRGVVVVVDAWDIEHPRESGKLVLSDKKSHQLSVVVTDGAFALPIDTTGKLTFRSAVLGGRDAYAFDGMSLEARPEAPLIVRLRWSPDIILHVRDVTTEAELGGIEVLLASGSTFGHNYVPPETEGKDFVVLRGDSPLTLRPGDIANAKQRNSICVRATGYAWSRAHLMWGIGGDAYVYLAPACGLDVEIVGKRADDPVVLRLTHREKFHLQFEEEIGTRTSVPIDDVAPGPYTISAQAGPRPPLSFTLATTSLDLVAGARKRVTLVLAPLPKVESADLTGVLVIPKEWGTVSAHLSARYADNRFVRPASTPDVVMGKPAEDGAPGLFSWRLEHVQVGRYELQSLQPPWVFVVELHPGGTSKVQLELPPPASVSVRVVDANTQEPLAPRTIEWGPAGTSGGGRRDVMRSSSTQTYDFVCPVGEIDVSAQAYNLGYERGTVTVALHAGSNVVTVPLAGATGIRFDLTKDSVPPDPRSRVEFDVHEVEGDGHVIGEMGGDSKLGAVQVTKPGRYRVRLSQPVAGCVTPSEQVVEVKAGAMTDVVIRLTRKP